MPALKTQAVLRETFGRWGLPTRIRVDNGTPWRSKGDLPTDLGLWLSALETISKRPGTVPLSGTHPGLDHSGRVYDRGQEPERLGVERARELPAGFVVPRRVDQSGTVSVYGRSHYVAKAYAGQVVYVRYAPRPNSGSSRIGPGINCTNARHRRSPRRISRP